MVHVETNDIGRISNKVLLREFEELDQGRRASEEIISVT